MTHQWKFFREIAGCSLLLYAGTLCLGSVVQRRSRLIVDRCKAAIDEQAHLIWWPLPIDRDHVPVLIG